MERKTFIYTLALGSGGMMLQGAGSKIIPYKEGTTQIRMIYNNTGKSDILKNKWGLSVWIEDEIEASLFDTGGDASVLRENIEVLNLNLAKLKSIIISHDHWDHTGGIGQLIEKCPQKLNLYVVSSTAVAYSHKYPKVNIVAVNSPCKISSNLGSTGTLIADEIGNDIPEQAVIFSKSEAIVLLTGCAHPGIVRIAERAKEIHPSKDFELIAGGFHLMRENKSAVEQISEELKNLKVNKIAPSHCTGEAAIDIFKKMWGDRFVDVNIGDYVPN